VFANGPLTPPLSPKPEQSIASISSQELFSDINHQCIHVRDIVSATSDLMDDKETVDEEMDMNPSSHPRRVLEDEAVRFTRSGLKLADFEVRGTLGARVQSLFLRPTFLNPSQKNFQLAGTGTFGKVLLVRHCNSRSESQSFYAMKILRKTDIVRLRQVEHVNAERYILSRVQHPFVVDLFATFQDSLNVYMLMSYVPGGELFTHLRRAQRFTPDVTRFYLATIILALKYLHSFNIIYRDLKPENLLLDSRGYLRLTDFGFAKIVDDRTWTLCGTPEYLAPEIIQSDGHGKAADWWACGVLCYEMLVGYPPFFDETPYLIYEKILNGQIHWPKAMDRLSRDLIKAFLNPDRSKRLGNMIGGPQDILDHPWFRGVDWEALGRREIRVNSIFFCRVLLFPSIDVWPVHRRLPSSLGPLRLTTHAISCICHSLLRMRFPDSVAKSKIKPSKRASTLFRISSSNSS